MTTPAIVQHLEALPRAKAMTSGGWKATCPAHEDSSPSLSWKTGDDGKVVVHDFGGCSTDAIVGAMGMSMADLYPPKAETPRKPRRRLLAESTYDIRGADGELVAIHVRLDYSDGSKSCPWRLPDGKDGLGGMSLASLPLYGSEHLPAECAESVVVTEGEKAADAVRAAGVLAVGTVTGAEHIPGPSSLAVLAGRDVVLWPDNDAIGRTHMERIEAELRAIASSVRWVDWPDAPPKGDAADVTDPETIRRLVTEAVPSQGTGTSGTTGTDRRALPDYLEAVRAFACRYVAFPSEHEPIAVAMWVAHAHLFEMLMRRYETSPVLSVTSAEMRSGKSRLLDVIEQLVPEPRRMVLPSEAVVDTILAQDPRPTLLLDEADAIFGPRTAEKYEGLRAILNAGNRKGSPVLRVKLDGKRREVESFDCFGPKVVAGIGDLPATVADRSIPIRLRRRRPDERVERFRLRTARAEAERIELDPHSVRLVDGYPDVPDELPDRAADGWEPLLALADAAGGAWPAMARLAAVVLSSEEPSSVTIGVRLLADVRDAFGSDVHLTTSALLERLASVDGAPWGDWYGKPMTSRALAKLLQPYGVVPRHSR